VVGGGISGLSAAYRLVRLADDERRALRVELLEAGPRLGGAIDTRREDGYLLETGPDSLLSQKPAGVALCRELGLTPAPIRSDGSSATLQLYHDGRLHAVPDGFFMMSPTKVGAFVRSPLFSWRGKLRAACEPWIPARRDDGDESLRSFVTRRFGREIFERAAEPIIAGLYTADADRLSLRTTMPRFLELERGAGSVARGLRRALRHRTPPDGDTGFVSLAGGMGTLVERLAASLPAASVTTGASVERLERSAGGERWRVHCAGGRKIDAAAVVLASTAHASATLLKGLDETLAADLGRLDYASCATVNLAYAAGDMRGPLEGFGFFVPRTAKLSLLACSYMSRKFAGRAPAGELLLRVFLGGALHPRLLERDDDALADRAHRMLASILGITGRPRFARVHRFPRAMPQFDVGDDARRRRIEQRLTSHPGLFLCGGAGGATGALGLPDCIADGDRAARGAWQSLSWTARGLELAI
jgi:oxygen-dependent protoporphyrinogen oxidase